MGAIGGGLWHTYKGLRNSPRGYKMIGTLEVGGRAIYIQPVIAVLVLGCNITMSEALVPVCVHRMHINEHPRPVLLHERRSRSPAAVMQHNASHGAVI
jgi:hypothetical protein